MGEIESLSFIYLKIKNFHENVTNLTENLNPFFFKKENVSF